MKRFFLLICFPLLFFCSEAQELSVLSFLENSQDLTARTYPRKDNNGDYCALVKVQVALTNVQFETSVVGNVADKVSEYWVYVYKGAKKLKIKHRDYRPLDVDFTSYGFSAGLQGRCTYIMKIDKPNVNGSAQSRVTQQYVLFRVKPENAILEFAGSDLVVSDGTASKRMPFGSYDYRVSAPLYHPKTGVVLVNDPDNKHVVDVALMPAHGFLSVPSTASLNGAKVFVDDKEVGTVPCRSCMLESGSHRVKIIRPNYKSVTQTIMIEDGKTYTFSPLLEADFADLKFKVENGAGDIYINGEYKGANAWQGRLASGAYQVECRKANHRSSMKEISVSANMGNTVINLQAPTPIVGAVDVSSVPADADVYMDGVKVGTTPLLLSNQLIGKHEISIKKKGYDDFSKSITLSENNTQEVVANLKKETPYKTYTVKGVTFKMVYVKGGTFTMGASSEQGSDAYDREKPTHRVTLSNYYMGETEVTQALWQAVMGTNPSYSKGQNLPVEQVSWNDCQTFVRKLNALTGADFRLPTEAEWEYAARGGAKSRGYKYSGGNTIDDVAWYDGNSSSRTHPVGTKLPNELELYDMSGNVWEWCSDWKGNYSSTSSTNPTGPSSGSSRVNRGGSWGYNAGNCRVSYRDFNNPGDRFSSIGLRLALSSHHSEKVTENGHEEFSAKIDGFRVAEDGVITLYLVDANKLEILADAMVVLADNSEVAISALDKTALYEKNASIWMKDGKVSRIKVNKENATTSSTSNCKTFTVKGVTFKMVYVAGGTFTMGATSEQGSDAYSDESPTHRVTLSDYYMGETEVTQALWEAVMGTNPSRFSGPNLPVERVSWNDCQTFVRKLNALTGAAFRLPTEAEWEYAARGGSKSRGYKYSGGNTIGDVAWYEGNSSSKTQPVGTKRPNELGLYDMSGNVFEWCSDRKGSYSSTSSTNPMGPSSGSYRVFRGGSWDFSARSCRVSYRDFYYPDDRHYYLGLRLALGSHP